MISNKIPTNIITGFLGVGKTSAILHLLAQRTPDERIAVLVNEFGAVGVDGSLFTAQRTTDEGIAVAEVPGGCMCCATGPLTQVALSKLIITARPQRLLIEPSGLGHPREVLQLLSGEYYHNVLLLHKTVTFVDARKLRDSRYTEHQTFNQQIAIADLVIGNKKDLYQLGDEDNLVEYVKRCGHPTAETMFTTHGEISYEIIQEVTQVKVDQSATTQLLADPPTQHPKPIPATGYLCETNSGEGFQTTGWRIDPAWIFSRDKLIKFLKRIKVERVKGVFVTDAGVFGYNRSQESLKELELDDCLETRVEIIATERDDDWQRQLFDCVMRK